MPKTLCIIGIFLWTCMGASLANAQDKVRATNFMNTTPSSDQLVKALKTPPGPPSPATKKAPKMLYRGLVIKKAKPSKVLLNIPFEFDSDQLTPTAVTTLRELGKALNSAELIRQRFVVEGHTDSKGAATYNQTLSERRAMAVADYLVTRHGISRNRLKPVGRGETSLFDRLNPEAGTNRRVEIINPGH